MPSLPRPPVSSLLALLLGAGCRSAGTTANPAPELAARSFRKIMVVATYLDPIYRRAAESTFVASVRASQQRFVAWTSLFRENDRLTREDYLSTLQANDIDATLVLGWSQPLWRYRETHSNGCAEGVWPRDSCPDSITTSAGYDRTRPWTSVDLTLSTPDQRPVWRSSMKTGTGAASSSVWVLIRNVTDRALERLAAEGIIR